MREYQCVKCGKIFKDKQYGSLTNVPCKNKQCGGLAYFTNGTPQEMETVSELIFASGNRIVRVKGEKLSKNR